MREITRRIGAVLIFDEVMTGFRLAMGGAQELYGITPDLTCLGKIMGGGLPVAAYGGVLLLTGVAYTILCRVLIASQGAGSTLADAIGSDRKAKASLALYALAVLTAFLDPRLACALYVVVAVLWLIPDRRIEKALARG